VQQLVTPDDSQSLICEALCPVPVAFCYDTCSMSLSQKQRVFKCENYFASPSYAHVQEEFQEIRILLLYVRLQLQDWLAVCVASVEDKCNGRPCVLTNENVRQRLLPTKPFRKLASQVHIIFKRTKKNCTCIRIVFT
jgi:hypothetical protein